MFRVNCITSKIPENEIESNAEALHAVAEDGQIH